MFECFETSRSDGVRQVNRARVMRLIQDKSGIDRTELASLIGVSNAAITNIVNELIAADIVQETISSGDSVARGRKRVGLQIDRSGGFVLGITAIATSVSIVLANIRGEVIDEVDVDPTYIENPEHTLKQIHKKARIVLQRNAVPMDRLFGIGFCVAGYLASDEQSLEFAPYIGWPNFNLSVKLQNMFGQNISVENVNRCIAMAEIRFGTMAETKDMILIRSALGLGGALVNEGRVLRGSQNFGGNLGHVLAVPDGELCSCGKRGCLNTVAAGWAVIHKLGAASSSYDTINKYRAQNEQLRELLGSEKMGDEKVISALSEAGSTLATHLLPIIQIMNPEAICLTGPVGRHSAYAESFRRTLLQFDLNCQIVLGNEAKIITPSMASVYLALSDMVYSPNFNFNQIAQTPIEARVS
tara:strand:+ start:77 stop:1318 length:1242 start_codon:yes stop_codon:yes gene_type:complete